MIKERDDGIIFRFASKEDKDQIYDFALDAISGADLPEFAEDAGKYLQERIEEGDPENVLLAEDTNESNKIVGYIELDPVRSKRRDAMYIRGIYVLPSYRRRGIGKELLEIIRSSEKVKGKQLRVEAFTKDGLAFWKDFGFQIHHYSLYLD